MTHAIDDEGRLVGLDELPESVRELTVAPSLVEAGMSAHEATGLDYIVDQVYFIGGDRRERLIRFTLLIVFSTMIAAFGLLADSVAVVIGAMLVAPLMTPIMGTAVSLVLTEPARLAASARTVAGGAAGAIAVGFLISVVASGGITTANIPAEVLSRTAPGLLDLGIAISAGLAGGYLLVDQKAAASAAGVAIAVALVPPLAVVGICLELGAVSLAGGALLLFATNFVAIVLAASGVIVAMGAIPRGFLRVRFRHLRQGFALVLAALVLVTVPLALHTRDVIQQERFERLVARSVTEWDPRTSLSSIEVTPGEVWAVDLTLAVAPDRSQTWRLSQLITERTGQVIDLDVRYLTEERDAASTR